MTSDLHHSRRPARRRRLLLTAAAGMAAVALCACGSSSTGTKAASTTPAGSSSALSVIKVGIGPFLDNQTLALAQELGFAKQQGIEFQFTTLPSNDAIFQAIQTGSIDMGAGTLRGLAPIVKQAPGLRNFIFRDQFLGFFLVGRKGKSVIYSDLIKQGVPPATAKQRVLKAFDHSTMDLVKIQNFPPIAAALQSAGLNPGNVTVNNFSDDAQAALAFEHGTGDYYTGALPQQAALLLNHPDQFVNAGGSEVLGATSATYDTWTTSQSWMADHPVLAKKVLAVVLKTNRFIKERLSQAAPMLAALVNKAASSNFSAAEVALLAHQFSDFLTPQELTAKVFNPSNPYYWQNEAKVAADQNKSALPGGYNITQSNDAQAFYNTYAGDSTLTSWVNGAL
ncbi:MAG: ABC transporter substrate-binding protein [Solirubrobacteraceae bacterium]